MTKLHLSGVLLDDECSLNVNEICQACMVQTEWIIELVNEGILNTTGNDTSNDIGNDVSNWLFSGSNLNRALTVKHLQYDLGVNLAGAALALDLMEEIKAMRERLTILERHY